MGLAGSEPDIPASRILRGHAWLKHAFPRVKEMDLSTLEIKPDDVGGQHMRWIIVWFNLIIETRKNLHSFSLKYEINYI